ncbi:MAG: hypothetical protein JJT76_03100 [Clostridiaceae bacterium]|nr:hypothetical protein [Clostridiaceae bacterium]
MVKELATILDTEYGEERIADEEGGYILILQSPQEFSVLTKVYLDINKLIPEYVDRITVENDEDWANALIICSNDFAISLILPISIAPKYLIEEMKVGEKQ